MLLLLAKIVEVMVDFSKGGRLLVHLLVRRLSFTKDAETSVHTIVDRIRIDALAWTNSHAVSADRYRIVISCRHFSYYWICLAFLVSFKV